MGTLPQVAPGDLITAKIWNDLIAELNALELRVADLEDGSSKSPPRITQVLPPGVVTEGDEIRIFGSNFGFTQGAQSVFFGNTRAIGFSSDSSDNLLVVQIPETVEGATDVGTAMTMYVGNLFGNTPWGIIIKAKPEVTTGGFQFSYKGSRPATPTQNLAIFYDFELKSFASQDLTVNITPTIKVIKPLPAGVTDPGLADLITVIDADGAERTNHQVKLVEGATKTISLRLNLPDKINGLNYSLSVMASAPGVSSVEESLPDQQVGLVSEQPDPTVSNFEFSMIAQGPASFSTDTGGVSSVDGTITIQAGTPKDTVVTIDMRTVFSGIPQGSTNQYGLGATVDPTTNWSASPYSSMPNPLRIDGPGGLKEIYFDIHTPGTPSTAILRLTLTRQDATTNNKRKAAYQLIQL